MGKITRFRRTSPTRSPPARSSSVPASVVKELVENAIDAGARRLSIHVELGGKKQVRVEDDGEGMEPDDARLAIERHATSKIRRADDLAAILTLGFRGEALPSIASVSHFVLRTRARGQQSGTEIRVNGGAVASVIEVGAAEGTVVEVNDLFYNLPARRKFLKSDGAESAQVSRVVDAAGAGVSGGRLHADERGRARCSQCPPAASLRDRLYQVYGERSDLIEVRKEAGGLRADRLRRGAGRAGADARPAERLHQPPHRQGPDDRARDHRLPTAMASIKERSPEVHLFIEMPPDAVDVNVHPTKAEVRFREQSLVHEVVRRALMDALGQQRRAAAAAAAGARGASRRSRRRFPACWPAASIRTGGCQPRPALQAGVLRCRGGERGRSGTAAAVPASVRDAGVAVDIQPMIPLGQFRDTFIIAVDDEGVAIIDQHVAHERVLFERVMERLTAGPARIAAAAGAAAPRRRRRPRIRRCSAAPPSSSVSASRSRASAARRSR